MIDELLFKVNHLGKDGFIWWLGQVAEAGVWKADSRQSNFLDDTKKEKTWTSRCKVRIIGYHPFHKGELEDKDLPWAHVMMDPAFGNSSGGEGMTANLMGGEVCFGFFLDGEDAQQPVIVGVLNRNRSVKNYPIDHEFAFRPFSGHPGDVPNTKREKTQLTEPGTTTPAPKPPPTSIPELDNELIFNTDFGGWGTTTGISSNFVPFGSAINFDLVGIGSTSFNFNINQKDEIWTYGESFSNNAFLSSVSFTYIPPTPCNNNLIGRITQALQDFIGITNTFQKYADAYINPVLNEVVDITSTIKSAASSIGGIIRLIINSIRSALMKCVVKLFKKFLAKIACSIKPLLSPAVKNILNMIYCLLENIVPTLIGYLEQLLADMVDSVIAAPLCAVDQWVAGILSKVMSSIEEATSTILSGVSWITGGLSKVFEILNTASSLANQIYSFIGCDALKCTTPSKWVSNLGPTAASVDDWEKTTSNVNVFKGVAEDLGSVESAISGLSMYSANPLTGSTSVTVSTNSSLIVGNNLIITNPGFGFTTGITTYLNVDLISLTGVGTGGQATIGVGTGVVYSAKVTRKGKKYAQGDILTIDYSDADILAGSVLLTVPEVEIKQTTQYKNCVINNPTTQDDLPSLYPGIKHKKCIPPIIDIIGDGIGGKLKPIIKSGKITAVDIISPGMDYTRPPILTVVDKSGHGKGARLQAKVDSKGSIESVIVLDMGLDYCPYVTDAKTSSNLAINSSKNRIYEGESVTFTVTSTDAEEPKTVDYVITGFEPQYIKQSLTGTLTLTNKRASITIETIPDQIIDTKRIKFELPDYDMYRNVIVEDISVLTPDPEYQLKSSKYFINEGASFKISLITRNVKDGTLVPFKISGIDERLIENYSLYTSFEVYDDKAELEFKTTKGVIQEDQVFKLELENGRASVGLLIYKIKSETNTEDNLCLAAIEVLAPGIGYDVRDTATDGINNYSLIISPENGAIFGAKPLSNIYCGYPTPPVIIINTITGIGAKLVPVMKLDTSNSSSVLNSSITGIGTEPGTGGSTGIIQIIDCI